MQTSSYPPIGRARFAQWVLAAIALVGAMDAGIGALLLEPMKRELGLSDVQAGLANTTGFYLAYGLLSAPFGMLADRTNRVRLLAAAVVLWCGALLIVALSRDLWWLVAGKALLGAANAAALPASLSLYSDYFAPERRAAATATYPLGQILGSTGAVLIGGFGYALLVAAGPHASFGLTPWRAVFLMFGAVALLLLPLVMAMREPQRMEVVQAGGGTMRELWRYRGFLAPLLLGLMFLSGLANGVMAWVAPALMRLYHQQPGDFAGWYSAVQLGSGVVGVLAAGRLVEAARRGGGRARAMVPAAVGALLCAPASCMALTPGIGWFAFALTLFTLSFAIAIAVPVIAINFRIPNELRGLAMGLYVLASSLGAGLATPAIARLEAVLGGVAMLGRAMALVGCPSAIIAALCFAAAARDGRDTGAMRRMAGQPKFTEEPAAAGMSVSPSERNR